MRSSEVGGQAVIEGVMMKNKDKYAVAVRKTDGSIVVDVKKTGKERTGILKAPIIRGVVAFIDSMVIGIKTLSFSASFFDEEEEPDEKEKKNAGKKQASKNADAVNSNRAKDKKAKKNKNQENAATEEDPNQLKLELEPVQEINERKAKNAEAEKTASAGDKLLIAGTVTFSIVLSVAIFMLLPMFLSRLLGRVIDNQLVLTLIEGGLRILIFLAYVIAISQVNDIKRVFCYHGAEHKSINCIENGLDLTVENVRGQARLHKRCGTSFMLFVIFISLIFFLFIRVDQVWLQAVIRVVLMPLIAGISYEIIRLAGKSNSGFVAAISKPGFMLQNLTTREPDDSMIECAIASVEAVFDWRSFVAQVREDQRLETETTAEKETEILPEEDTQPEEEKQPQAEKTSAKKPAENKTTKNSAPESAAIEKPEKEAEAPAAVQEPAPKKEINLSSLDKVLTVNKKEKLQFKDPPRNRETPKIIEPTEDDEILQALDKFFVFEDKDD